MKLTQRNLLIILLIPFLAILLMAGTRMYRFNVGKEIIVSIEGRDPRDLFRGRYLVYRVMYGVEKICYDNTSRFKRQGFICLDENNKSFSYTRISDCSNLIIGACQRSRFLAGIEKFFVPEESAKDLEKYIIAKKGSLKLSLSADGKPQIKDLLIEGKSWKEVIE